MHVIKFGLFFGVFSIRKLAAMTFDVIEFLTNQNPSSLVNQMNRFDANEKNWSLLCLNDEKMLNKHETNTTQWLLTN